MGLRMKMRMSKSGAKVKAVRATLRVTVKKKRVRAV